MTRLSRNSITWKNQTGATIISADARDPKATTGARIAMTLRFQLATSSTTQICPKRNTVNNKPDSQQGMTE
ncbi:hypothetical protein GGR58DRAFT_382015 [Xylaria digitata]|nr:hypothetical protein GGR58DRAFT_382015 [Xylaria digitata]